MDAVCLMPANIEALHAMIQERKRLRFATHAKRNRIGMRTQDFSGYQFHSI